MPDRYPFEDLQQAESFDGLTHRLKCVMCQGQSLADSSAPLARDMRQHIYVSLRNGIPETEIQTKLIAQYGDEILLEPPVKAETYLLWVGPLLLALIAGACLKALNRGQHDET